jgi:hypothetical protein
LDGQVSSYFEWLQAGVYQVDTRQGAMHGGKLYAERLWWGSDGERLYLRLDPAANADLTSVSVRLEGHSQPVEIAHGRIVECATALNGFEQFAVVLHRDGAPVQRLPNAGALRVGQLPTT